MQDTCPLFSMPITLLRVPCSLRQLRSCVGVAPITHRLDDRREVLTTAGQRILHPEWFLIDNLSVHQLVLLKVLKAVREDVAGDAIDRSLSRFGPYTLAIDDSVRYPNQDSSSLYKAYLLMACRPICEYTSSEERICLGSRRHPYHVGANGCRLGHNLWSCDPLPRRVLVYPPQTG